MNSSCTLLLPVKILAVHKAGAQELVLMCVSVCGVYPEGWSRLFQGLPARQIHGEPVSYVAIKFNLVGNSI